ncbi:MAG: hypothetical protein AUH30_06850 [Candidatus Rokubacteria bacterium 13_1_40CM_68_15]|nr:MAG: hypothetical protein AUH30_06850 [Candidatus Rokubacteria bacterium 13_1_40CM_68_15]
MSRWIGAAGVFVISLDSMVNIAFPAMAASFGLSAPAMRWVIVCYVLSYALLSFAGGALGDRIGYRPVFVAGLAGSAIAYAVAAVAPTFGWLLTGRVVQGIAGGLVYGTAPAIVTAGADRLQRRRQLGFLNAALGLAFAIGPIVAGLLVATVGWRAVFSVRAPLALIPLVAALRGLPRDGGGAIPGPMSARDVGRRSVLHLGVLPFIAFGGNFAIWLLAPFYIVERRGLGPVVGGLMFMLTPLGMTLGAPLAARLAERLGSRVTVVTGLLVEAMGLGALGTAGATTPLAAVAAELFAAGLGLGVFVVPNMAALMEEFKAHQQGAAGGFAFLARTLGIVVGVLAWAEIFALARGSLGFDVAFERALLAAGASVLVAAVLAMLRLGG